MQDRLHFALNFEFLVAEFFVYGAFGVGLDVVAPGYAMGGPPPIGAQKANLDPPTERIIEEFGYEKIGRIRAIIETLGGGIQRPLLNISRQQFAEANSVNFFLPSYAIPNYPAVAGYVGTIPELTNTTIKRMQRYVRCYKIADFIVPPYGITVAEFTDKISNLRNQLAMCGNKDEGIIVPKQLGAENRTESNILSADANSISYDRTPREVLRISYGTGNASMPGGFLPQGGNGVIAKSFLENAWVHHQELLPNYIAHMFLLGCPAYQTLWNNYINIYLAI
ncbi:hypothetical protein Tsubulata_041584 [Turnera subulata]|uniref:Uncharacterized protein n=1 Tax=Turnera subulata TaxID=218843 RepID=A0A9Q0J233_9ROSI|nr:hypothetical protein Tsubulata_041584 [Turnera subulata]